MCTTETDILLKAGDTWRLCLRDIMSWTKTFVRFVCNLLSCNYFGFASWLLIKIKSQIGCKEVAVIINNNTNNNTNNKNNDLYLFVFFLLHIRWLLLKNVEMKLTYISFKEKLRFQRCFCIWLINADTSTVLCYKSGQTMRTLTVL